MKRSNWVGKKATSAMKCRCGTPLITLDEQARQACWKCGDMARRLKVLDYELKMLEWACRKA